MVDCPQCASDNLDVVFGHACPNDPAWYVDKYVNGPDTLRPVPVDTRNGSGQGTGTGRNKGLKATDKQVAFMLSLGVPEHIANAATKASASDHIARILEENKRNGQGTVTADKASDKQIAFIKSLLRDRPDAFTGDVDTLSKREASDLIGKLKAMPKVATPRAAEDESDFSDGFYVDRSDVIYKVQRSQTGNLYAKVLDTDTGEFVYTSGAVSKLRRLVASGSAERLSLERAKGLGRLYGRCMVCGRTLTDETSIANGIGPICEGRF
jgi:hypothetical protein